MIRPPMTDFVTIMTPTGEVDRYGRPVTSETVSVARVEFTGKAIETTDGTRRVISAEIDLPPETPVDYGYSIKYKNPLGQEVTSNVLKFVGAYDFAKHVLYWTVSVA